MNKPLRVLIVEDSEDDTLLLLRELRRGGYEPAFERVETPEAMRAALEKQEWDIVISDYILPNFSGLAALTLLRESGLDLPFIIVSGNIGEDIAVGAMKAGAHDYIIKGNLARLVPAVERELRDAEGRREARRAEEALRENERLLRTVLETLPVGVWIVDKTGKIVHGNPATRNIWAGARYVGMDLYGEYKGWWVSTGKQIEPEEWAAARAITKGETSIDEEIEIECFDGTHKIILNSAIPIRNERQEITSAIIVNQDITDRKRADQALRENNELLENMFSNIHVKIAYMDTEFNFVRVNRTYAEADGKTPEFFPGKNHFTLYPNEENEVIFRRVVETGEPYFAYEKPFEYAEHPERGATYWDWSLVPIKEGDGRIIGVVLSLIDVTDRKLAEVDRDRLAAAVASTADAVAITEPLGGLIQYVNPAFERISGYTRDEVVGRSLHILDSGKHDAVFYQELRETLEREGVWRGTLINKKKDGTLYFEECTYSPVRDPSGKIMNYVSVKRDVTEKLRLESIVESVNTMENIGYVFSGVRHEIGNPINTAKMILSVLQHKLDKSTKEDIREQIDRTMTEIARVEYLLKSLKNFNLYESLDIQAVDMGAFLTRFLSLLAEDYDRKNITIKTDLSPEATRAYADPRALQHVLLNVFSNAADALEGRDDPTILITVLKRNGRIHIGVTDNGSGMSETQQKDLFKPFYTSKNQGTGLGLVIVKKMLAKMNGTIEVTSVQNQGTTVDIALPEGRDGTG